MRFVTIHDLTTVYHAMNGTLNYTNLSFRVYPHWPWGDVFSTEVFR